MTVILCLFCVFVNMAAAELYYIPRLDSGIKMKTTDETVPWLGVLRLKTDSVKSSEFLSVVTLIAKYFAIGCSYDISKINKKSLNSSTLVTFYNLHLVPWNTFVEDYYLHPEHDDETINTIAVLKLSSETKVPDFMWRPVRWPDKFYNQENHSSIYSIGYTDRGLILEQEISQVKAVDQIKCIDFYTSEGMDFKRIWPTHFNCFKVVGDNTTCVYESGMAVAANDSGKWTLIGVGTYGPGCSLPARYIEVFPYIPWIKSVMAKLEPPDPIIYSRRYTWMDESQDDPDTNLLAILYNYNIEIFPNKPKVTYWNLTELSCANSSRNIIYKEQGYIKLSSPIPTATMFYSVSLFDDNYDFECVKIFLDCLQKSQTQIFVQRGFGQENLEPLIKEVVPQDLDGKLPDKYLFITDNYAQYLNKAVTTVWFKFNFLRVGRMTVDFYGSPKPSTTTSTTPPTTTTGTGSSTQAPTTTRRVYPSFLNWDIYKEGQNG